jgi:hypothetical protein
MSSPGAHGELGTYPFVAYIKGVPLNHPPVPGDNAVYTSTRQPEVINTGDQPGPYQPIGGPARDPRLVYPRILATRRPDGQGCSSCRWNTVCKLLFWQLNFGNIQTVQVGQNGKTGFEPSLGTACESWNGSFPNLLPPGSYDNDGIGMGDPYSAGTIPPEALDGSRYDGQYGDLRSPGSTADTSSIRS